MDWEQTAKTVAPTVATALFGPLGGIAASIVGRVLLPDATAKGTVTPQDVASKIAALTDPADLAKLRQAEGDLKKFEADNDFRFAQLDAAGIDSARTMRVGSLASGNRTADRLAWLAMLSFLSVAGLIILLIGLLLSRVINIDPSNSNAWLAGSGLIGSILGYFSANANQVVGFYFGSSSGSAAKSEQLGLQAAQALTALTRVPPITVAPATTSPPPSVASSQVAQAPTSDPQTKTEVEQTFKATVTQTSPGQPVDLPGTVLDVIPDRTAKSATTTTGVAAVPDAESRFARALDFVFAAEEGFSNIPEDHGGATKFGITIGDLQRHRGHPVTIADVQALTKGEAREILKTEYWDAVSGDSLPEALDLCAFDGGVLCGPQTSVRFLQRAMGFIGRNVDGIAGHDTIVAAQNGPTAKIIQGYAVERRDFHRQTVADKPDQKKFLDGWLTRVDNLEREALRLAG